MLRAGTFLIVVVMSIGRSVDVLAVCHVDGEGRTAASDAKKSWGSLGDRDRKCNKLDRSGSCTYTYGVAMETSIPLKLSSRLANEAILVSHRFDGVSDADVPSDPSRKQTMKPQSSWPAITSRRELRKARIVACWRHIMSHCKGSGRNSIFLITLSLSLDQPPLPVKAQMWGRGHPVQRLSISLDPSKWRQACERTRRSKKMLGGLLWLVLICQFHSPDGYGEPRRCTWWGQVQRNGRRLLVQRLSARRRAGDFNLPGQMQHFSQLQAVALTSSGMFYTDYYPFQTLRVDGIWIVTSRRGGLEEGGGGSVEKFPTAKPRHSFAKGGDFLGIFLTCLVFVEVLTRVSSSRRLTSCDPLGGVGGVGSCF